MKRAPRWLLYLTLVYIGVVVVVVLEWERIGDYLTGWQVVSEGRAKARFAGITFGPEHRPGRVAQARQPAIVHEVAPFAWIEVLDRMGPPYDAWDVEDLVVTDSKGNPYPATSPVAYYAGAREGDWTLTYAGIMLAHPLSKPYDLTIRLRLKKQDITSGVLTFRAAGEAAQERAAR